MLVFDELKKNDPHLRLVAVMLVAGFGVLFAGLWWVQVVSSREYQSHLETQSYRSIRLPAVRGKILDRDGRVLAENRPLYNLSLYLDDMRRDFDVAYGRLLRAARVGQQQSIAAAEKQLDRSLTKAERKQFAFTSAQIQALREQARQNVAGAVVATVSEKISQPLTLNPALFQRHYAARLALPYPILQNLDPAQMARFEEHYSSGLGADLELQSVRRYPLGPTASHLLGYLRRDDRSYEGEDSSFSYRLPDYRGVVGLEYAYDSELRGRAGAESVLVNNLGYRQSENLWNQPEPGQNLVLTLDLELQQAAEAAVVRHQGTGASAAVVVMDVRNGDVLAMTSSPEFDPNDFAEGISQAKWDQLQQLTAEKNRATAENYAPGSVFKVIVGLAALEAGLNPERRYTVEPDPEDPRHGWYHSGRISKRDTAPPGDYNFKRGLERSSNSYFIQVGLQTGVQRIVALAEQFHLGERAGLHTRQETSGELPSLERTQRGWSDGDTANLCIGQGELSVTPLQMAVVYSTVANGGKVFWPRLVDRVEPQDPSTRGAVTHFPVAVLRDQIGVSARSLRILHEAMLGETEDAEGTGKAARVPGLKICGKTGTAQVQDSANRTTGYNYWFGSFAPYENPRYAVMVMVQIPGPMRAGGGGAMCAPIAHDIYEEIVRQETAGAGRRLAAK